MPSEILTTPARPTVDDCWAGYFAQNHPAVIAETTNALFAAAAPDYLHVCGLSLIAQGQLPQGVALLKSSLVLYSAQPNWFVNCAVATLAAGDANEALAFSMSGLQTHNDPILWFTMGNALMALGRYDEAAAPFVKALELKPDLTDARINLGNVMRQIGNLDAALSLYTQVVNAQPNNGIALINRAVCLMDFNRHDEASMLLLRIMATSEAPQVSFLMAMLRLMEGDFENGFDLYRSRLDCPMGVAEKALQRAPVLGSISEAAGKHVLVTHEQGYGDSIQFARYIPDLASRVGRVTLLVPSALIPLFVSLGTNITLVSDRTSADPYDFECPMLHLPYLFGTTLATIPAALPYLSVPTDFEPSCVTELREGTTHKVGLVWAGQRRDDADLALIDTRRSLHFRDYAGILAVPGITFVSLQTGIPASQMTEDLASLLLPQPSVVLDAGSDFLDTAAVIMGLDLVITVDTAVAHLAGALGKPVWVLSRFDQCWRWLKGRDDSPWYPGVLRLFHQETRGDWSATLVNVQSALEQWAARTP